MNWETIEGKWDQLTGKVKTKWGKLTDDDVSQIKGRKEELIGRVRERYGVAKDEAERQVDEWISKV